MGKCSPPDRMLTGDWRMQTAVRCMLDSQVKPVVSLSWGESIMAVQLSLEKKKKKMNARRAA